MKKLFFILVFIFMLFLAGCSNKEYISELEEENKICNSKLEILEENIEDDKIKNIDREKALSDPKRISNIVKYIIEQFNRKTKRNSRLYELNKIKNISEVVETKDQTKI